MKVLFLSQLLPFPLDAGPKIRSYFVLRHLAEAGHEITLLAFNRPSDQPAHFNHLKKLCKEIRTVPIRRSRVRDLRKLTQSLASREPFLIVRDWMPEMAKEIESLSRLSGSFDAIHADQLWMAPYAKLARQHLGGGTTILDQHNAVFKVVDRLALCSRGLARRIFLRHEAEKVQKYEQRVLQQFDRVVWVSQEDRDSLAGQVPTTAVDFKRHSVIPICVDPVENQAVERKSGARRVTFLGGLHWPPNSQGVEWFVRTIWPEVLNKVPEARLTIIGKSSANPNWPSCPSIELTGYVEDPHPYLKETAVFIVPLQAGAGMRVKILDAWCWGLPVVTTTLGSEGVRVEDGGNALVADDSRTFSSAVVGLFEDRALADSLARRGQETVQSDYNWRKIYSAWDEVYSGNLGPNNPCRPHSCN